METNEMNLIKYLLINIANAVNLYSAALEDVGDGVSVINLNFEGIRQSKIFAGITNQYLWRDVDLCDVTIYDLLGMWERSSGEPDWRNLGKITSGRAIDKLRAVYDDLGYQIATTAGLSWGISDVTGKVVIKYQTGAKINWDGDYSNYTKSPLKPIPEEDELSSNGKDDTGGKRKTKTLPMSILSKTRNDPDLDEAVPPPVQCGDATLADLEAQAGLTTSNPSNVSTIIVNNSDTFVPTGKTSWADSGDTQNDEQPNFSILSQFLEPSKPRDAIPVERTMERIKQRIDRSLNASYKPLTVVNDIERTTKEDRALPQQLIGTGPNAINSQLDITNLLGDPRNTDVIFSTLPIPYAAGLMQAVLNDANLGPRDVRVYNKDFFKTLDSDKSDIIVTLQITVEDNNVVILIAGEPYGLEKPSDMDAIIERYDTLRMHDLEQRQAKHQRQLGLYEDVDKSYYDRTMTMTKNLAHMTLIPNKVVDFISHQPIPQQVPRLVTFSKTLQYTYDGSIRPPTIVEAEEIYKSLCSRKVGMRDAADRLISACFYVQKRKAYVRLNGRVEPIMKSNNLQNLSEERKRLYTNVRNNEVIDDDETQVVLGCLSISASLTVGEILNLNDRAFFLDLACSRLMGVTYHEFMQSDYRIMFADERTERPGMYVSDTIQHVMQVTVPKLINFSSLEMMMVELPWFSFFRNLMRKFSGEGFMNLRKLVAYYLMIIYSEDPYVQENIYIQKPIPISDMQGRRLTLDERAKAMEDYRFTSYFPTMLHTKLKTNLFPRDSYTEEYVYKHSESLSLRMHQFQEHYGTSWFDMFVVPMALLSA